MTKKSIVLFSLMLVTLIPCKSGGNVMTKTMDPDLLRTIFKYDENQLAIRNLFTNDATKLQQFRAAVRQFFSQGYSQGYDEGDAKNIIAYFECAVGNQKTLMEVYKEPTTKAIWAGKELSDNEAKKIKLPADLEYLITENDKWIAMCEAPSFGNGQTGHNEYSTVTSRNCGTLPFTTKEKSSTKIRATTPFSIEEAKNKVLLLIKKSAANWFHIVLCNGACPRYVFKLQELLQQIQADNSHIENVNEIYWRFAVHTARSYKMMCTVHHKLMKNLKKLLSHNEKEETFERLLFKCAPSWNITYEQIFFLNVLKDARDPKHEEPLRYYSALNNEGKLTFIIYDDSSKCPRDQLLGRPTAKKQPVVSRNPRKIKNRQTPVETEKAGVMATQITMDIQQIKHLQSKFVLPHLPSPRKPRSKN